MNQNTNHRLPKGLSLILSRGFVAVICITGSFYLGLQTVRDIQSPVDRTEAQASETTHLNIILQFQPLSGPVIPIEVTPFMNSSQSALLQLQEIHSGIVFPSDPQDRCRTTNSAGRCTVSNLPIGTDAQIGTDLELQYDIFFDAVFIEFLTGLAIEPGKTFIRFDISTCGTGNSFDLAAGGEWCLGPIGGPHPDEYFLTITLEERDDCTDTVPPAPLCHLSGDIVDFICNPSFTGPTRPWEPRTQACDTVQCPDGNFVPGVCAEPVPGLAACSTAASCVNNQLCSVQNFGTQISYDAGADTIVITGQNFGTAGGTVSFPLENGREVVTISAGPDWTNTEIHVQVPLFAVSGTLEIHPNTHGSVESAGEFIPVICLSPPASIRSFRDRFVILSINAVATPGLSLVTPGSETEFILGVRHNDNVGRLRTITVELAEGSFLDAENIPLQRTILMEESCTVVTSNPTAKEASVRCTVTIPQTASQFTGPFTFIVTLVDDKGNSERVVLLTSEGTPMIGDFNLDLSLGIEDAVIALRIANGVLTASADHIDRDTDRDGVITFADALFVLHSLTQ